MGAMRAHSIAALLAGVTLVSGLTAEALAPPPRGSAQLSSFVSLTGVAAVKSGRSSGEIDTTIALSFGDDAFQMSLGPCYSVTGSVTPRGKKGTKLKLTLDDASREPYRGFMTLLAARGGANPSPALRARTKLLLTLNDDDTATLKIKTRLPAGKGKAASVKAELTGLVETPGLPPVPERCRFPGPTSSQPLALTARGDFLAAVNPENDTVSFFDVRPGAGLRLAEVAVQDEPNGVVFLPDGSKAYVANTVSGTLSVIPTDLANGVVPSPVGDIPVGAEPYGLALTPNGSKLYVSNARSGSVSVVDTATDTVIGTIPNAGPEPRGLAVTNDGDDDDLDETLFVTQFLSQLDPGKVDGADDAKSGRVTVIDTALDMVTGTNLLPPLADTGFQAAGDALARVLPGADFTFPTGAYPNQLNNVALKGPFVYVPNTGASPNGPFRFDVNVQSLLSYSDAAGAGAGSINMQLAVANQTSETTALPDRPLGDGVRARERRGLRGQRGERRRGKGARRPRDRAYRPCSSIPRIRVACSRSRSARTRAESSSIPRIRAPT